MRTEQWCLDLVCADPVLRWLILFLAAGTVFWYIMLYILSRGFLGHATAANPGGRRFSIFRIQLPFSHTAFRRSLDTLPAKSVKPLQWSLKLDFVFMAFAYPLLTAIAWYLQRNTNPAGANQGWQQPVLQAAVWLPFVAWALDILENILSFACLRKVSWLRSRMLLLTALLKWIVILAVVTGMIAAAAASHCCHT
ncbi:hypothetical protein [Taibaiella koreensis]|uniref:hypothetical protein n=1 Tax=Taibaiella koreensis TaxID=1268548 RepID=UPI000E59C938|nr:hypothetical protein [Taibaiella koreensis]